MSHQGLIVCFFIFIYMERRIEPMKDGFIKVAAVPPKVKVAVSPRGDLRMPSDACANIWLKELEEL